MPFLIVGRHGRPTVAAMERCSTGGRHATDRRIQEQRLFARSIATW